MPEKIRLRQAVVVEGKYDKIKLDAVVDAFILTTDGFRLYKDKEQRALLRFLARSRGLVVLTDSDRAGFQLRHFISNLAAGGEVLHAYIPDIAGKERRKRAPGAEGTLGVEGMDPAVLLDVLRRAGALDHPAPPPSAPITRQDFYEDGLIGAPGSADRRRALYRRLGLPARLSTSAALQALSHMITREEYKALVGG